MREAKRLVRRLLLIALLLGACSADRGGVTYSEAIPAPVSAPGRTRLAPEVESVTTTSARPAPPARASRGGRPSRPQAPPAPARGGGAAIQGGDFWRRLANCECASGHCHGPYVGYFQFSHDTAAKVGIDGSESYEEQLAAAQRWLGMIGGRGGSRSGWPVCWWKAGGS